VRLSSRGRIRYRGLRPRIRARDVLAAAVQVVEVVALSAPRNHLCSGPNRGVIYSAVGRNIGRRCPTVSYRVVFPARARKVKIIIFSAPHDHLSCGPNRRVKFPGRWCVSNSCDCPAIRERIVSSAGV
jgi:hypothetical protein